MAVTADEEYESVGTRAMLERGVRADAAIVGEPTRLEVMPAHRGFVWIEIVVAGRAAHGSRWDLGVDAIRLAGLLLAELDRVDAEELSARTHPLLGRASLHASTHRGRDRHVDVSRPVRAAPRAAYAARRDGRGRGGGGAARVRRRSRAAAGARRRGVAPHGAGSERRRDGRARRARARGCAAGARGRRARDGDVGVDRCRAAERGGDPGDLLRPGRHLPRACGGGVHSAAEIDRATSVLATFARRWCA